MTHALAIDIGGTTTKLAVVSDRGTVTKLWTHPTTPIVLHSLLLKRIVPRLSGVAGIGIAIAGFVNDERSAMTYNPNLSWLQRFPLRELVEQTFHLPVSLEADSNAACLAEHHFGIGRGVDRFLCLTIGTGVGGGMIVDGEIVRLAHGGLGDIGHVIVDPRGRPCDSGCIGCAEAMISAPGIEARDGRARSTRRIIEAAKKGDVRARKLLTQTGRLLGIALASQAVITFPNVIAIAGGVAEAGEFLIAPARRSFHNQTGPYYRDGVRIEKAKLGWQATLVGAVVPFFKNSN